MALLVLLNNFMHDFSAAGWIFCSILLWVILKSLPDAFSNNSGDELSRALVKIIRSVRIFMVFSLAGIIVFGILRAFAYSRYEWSAEAGTGQITLLIIKHILLTVVFAIGAYYYFRAGKIIHHHE